MHQYHHVPEICTHDPASHALFKKGVLTLSTVSSLIGAATAVQKLDILSDDSDWKFDFNTEAAGANGLGKTAPTPIKDRKD